MKKKFRFIATLLLAVIMLMCTSVLVFASDQPGGGDNGGAPESQVEKALPVEGGTTDTYNAIYDIMENERYQGAMSTITGITNFVDVWFIRIITVVAFFIISAALLKNACAGAYCANSKFWDKVDQAHKAKEKLNLAAVGNYFKGKQFLQTDVAGMREFFLSLIPNIKAFTEWEDTDLPPRTYFMRAIPQMIACVVIGVFIYNGYYRDTAATVGQMGSVLVSRTLNSVDPESTVNFVFNMTSWPEPPTATDTSREGKLITAVCNSIKSTVASNFKDVTTSEQKTIAMNNISAIVIQSVDTPISAAENKQDGAGDAGGDNPDTNAGLTISNIISTTKQGYIYKVGAVTSKVGTDRDVEGDVSDVGENTELGKAAVNKASFKFVSITQDEKLNYVINVAYNLKKCVESTDMTSGNQWCYVTMHLKRAADDGTRGAADTKADNGTKRSASSVTIVTGISQEALTTMNQLDIYDLAMKGTLVGTDNAKPTIKAGTLSARSAYADASGDTYDASGGKAMITNPFYGDAGKQRLASRGSGTQVVNVKVCDGRYINADGNSTHYELVLSVHVK